MKLPALNGTCDQTEFFIYTACDSAYFDEFAPALIKSVLSNTELPIHMHIFNPRPDQLAVCQQPRMSVTWEYVDAADFTPAAKKWNGHTESTNDYLRRTLTAMAKGKDATLQERLLKTYFACARFIRLAELFNPSIGAFAIDVDAVVRKNINSLANADLYIHHIAGNKARYLAGGMFLNARQGCQGFLDKYAKKLSEYFEQDNIYWGIDQDVLDKLVHRYNWAQLPTTYIDWNMHPDSCIWTAKGTRKENPKFIAEQTRYKS